MTSSRLRSGIVAWESALSAPIDTRPYLWFRRLFVFKLAAFAALMLWARLSQSMPQSATQLGLLLVLVIAAGILGMVPRTRYLPGLVGLLAYELWNIARTFPFTLNHHFFETAVVLIMVIFPAIRPAAMCLVDVVAAGAPDGSRPPPVIEARPVRLIQLAIVLVWVYAGIQKLVHQRYWNGELLALYALYSGGRFEGVTQWLVSLMTRVAGVEAVELPLTWPTSLTPQPLGVPAWLCAWFIWLGRATVLLELALPLGMAVRRTRRVAVIGLVLLQLLIALLTGEISFGLSGLVCAVLFWSYVPVLYALVAVVLLIGVMVTGLGVL